MDQGNQNLAGTLHLHSHRRVLGEILEPRRLPLSGRNIDVHGDGPACGKSTRPKKEAEETEKACFEKEFHGNFVASPAIAVKKFQAPFGLDIHRGNLEAEMLTMSNPQTNR